MFRDKGAGVSKLLLDEAAIRESCSQLAQVILQGGDASQKTLSTSAMLKVDEYWNIAKRFSESLSRSGVDPRLVGGMLGEAVALATPGMRDDLLWLETVLQAYVELLAPSVPIGDQQRQFRTQFCRSLHQSLGHPSSRTGPSGVIAVRELWQSASPDEWEQALDRYWELVRPENIELEKRLESLQISWLRSLGPQAWYDFLHDDYFRWKYTASNRYATTTKSLRYYLSEGKLQELLEIGQRLWNINPNDVRAGLSIASEIRGLGTAGASGLLSLVYPMHYGTVDQFVVKALREVDGLPEATSLAKMKPEGLSLRDGELLIQIMHRKAMENNERFAVTHWTPRLIDKVLWTYGR
ncbi:hypothetical protein Psta_0201 [Pirellula staleyi DSM 6068]|uniref:Uncharacterized protein n=1 Tax=Pirellula staleyi (strain ATCC 27377 / DSM 6068 / ICPB 4128) TaxID=530564 RepID=D2R1B2_PIRSD|nr:hypothetical protein Psta_0201 [Pirellula staleyi DSM 6068]